MEDGELRERLTKIETKMVILCNRLDRYNKKMIMLDSRLWAVVMAGLVSLLGLAFGIFFGR